MSATGHCNCGKVTVEVNGGLPDAAILCRAPPPLHLCTCPRRSHRSPPRRLHELPQDQRERVSSRLNNQLGLHNQLTARRPRRSFSTNLVVKKSDLVIKGEEHIKEYRDTNTDSGCAIIRHFCANCGSPIAGVPEADNSTYFLKGGLFNPHTLPSKVQAELFTRNLESWQKVHEGAHPVQGMS
ncbi:hypothetical protein OF846_001554 [Rhodotorula toruloides]|nr:hypothetical protein OF846_001554 [Rhodotorula toruloides]